MPTRILAVIAGKNQLKLFIDAFKVQLLGLNRLIKPDIRYLKFLEKKDKKENNNISFAQGCGML